MTTPGDPSHRHDQLHRGQVPTDQLADGTASLGFVGISNGDGTVTWGAQSGGGSGSSCDHRHASEAFVAAGGSPETFTLSYAPLWDRRAYVQGARVTPANVGGSGITVEVDTAAADEVVIDYEAECATPLVWPGDDMVLGGDHQNVLATIVTTTAAILILDLTEVESAGGAFGDDIGLMNAADTYLSSDPPLPDVQSSPSVGTYIYRIPYAGTWYIVGGYGFGSYVGDLAGAGSYTLITPPSTGSLSFPGASDITVQNELLSIVTTAGVYLFVTIDADLPIDYYLGAMGDNTGDHWFLADSGQPFPAGSYVFVTDVADATLQVYAFLAGVYDAGLTGTGTYGVVNA